MSFSMVFPYVSGPRIVAPGRSRVGAPIYLFVPREPFVCVGPIDRHYSIQGTLDSAVELSSIAQPGSVSRRDTWVFGFVRRGHGGHRSNEAWQVIPMLGIERFTQPPVRAAYRTATAAIAPAADFGTPWVARVRVHGRRGRRKFIVWAGVLAMGAAFVYAFLR